MRDSSERNHNGRWSRLPAKTNHEYQTKADGRITPEASD